MGLREVFDEAAERVKQLPDSPSNEDQLELYSNYKQANVGDCSTGTFTDRANYFLLTIFWQQRSAPFCCSFSYDMDHSHLRLMRSAFVHESR